MQRTQGGSLQYSKLPTHHNDFYFALCDAERHSLIESSFDFVTTPAFSKLQHSAATVMFVMEYTKQQQLKRLVDETAGITATGVSAATLSSISNLACHS